MTVAPTVYEDRELDDDRPGVVTEAARAAHQAFLAKLKDPERCPRCGSGGLVESRGRRHCTRCKESWKVAREAVR